VNAHVQRLIEMSVTCEHIGELVSDDPSIGELARRIVALRASMENLDVQSVGVGDRAKDMVGESVRKTTEEENVQKLADELEKWMTETHRLAAAPLERRLQDDDQGKLKEVSFVLRIC
jgi:predicted transcriptional regulator